MSDDEPWLSADQQHMWRTWLRVNSDLHSTLARDLQNRSDLSYSDFTVLVKLTDHPDGRLRVTGLADALQWERSRVSHHIKRMEARGLVSRSDCAEDGRVAFLDITELGRRAIESAAPDHAALVRRLVFEDIPAEDLAAFHRVNSTIASRIGAAPDSSAGQVG